MRCQGCGYAGHQRCMMHDTHTGNFHRKERRCQRCSKQSGKARAHTAHNNGTLAVGIQFYELTQLIGNTAAQLQCCTLPAGRAATQLSNGGGNKDQRSHFKWNIRGLLNGCHHGIGTLIAGISATAVQKYDQQTAYRQGINDPGMLCTQVVDKNQRMTKESAD